MAGQDWRAYFEAMKAANQEAVIPPVRMLVLGRDLSPSEDGLGRSVKGVLKRLRDADWPIVELHHSLVAVSDEYRMADSKKKPGAEAPEHRRGDLSKPAHTTKHWWLHAAHPAYRLGMRVHWTEGVTPKGGRSFGFQSAHVHDPLGMPTECFADYSVSGITQAKDEPGHIFESRLALAEAAARRRDREYNDGMSWLNRRPMFKAFKEFELWLGEAIEMTTPKESNEVEKAQHEHGLAA